MTQWKWYLGGYTLLILTIFALAYLKYIPTELNTIPDYDSIGHFVLYGIWGYLFALRHFAHHPYCYYRRMPAILITGQNL